MDDDNHTQNSRPGCNLKNLHSKTFIMFETIRVSLPVFYSLVLRLERKTGKKGSIGKKRTLSPQSSVKPLAAESQEF